MVGAYAIHHRVTDVYWMLGFGVLGYVLRRHGYPVAPIILGMILGPLMDRSYRQAMLSAQEDPLIFASEFLTSPLSALILAALVFTVLRQTGWYRRLLARRRGRSASG